MTGGGGGGGGWWTTFGGDGGDGGGLGFVMAARAGDFFLGQNVHFLHEHPLNSDVMLVDRGTLVSRAALRAAHTAGISALPAVDAVPFPAPCATRLV
eukprot:scaffold128839_cov30-Tisochrysis_lutea.AAC.1